jgi:hypothetical protein
MFNTKTHFDQVPLEMVKKIIEEQIQQEIATELDLEPEYKPAEVDHFGATTIDGDVQHLFSRGAIETIHESQRQEIQEHVQEKRRIRCSRFSRFGRHR